MANKENKKVSTSDEVLTDFQHGVQEREGKRPYRKTDKHKDAG
jgi:hypothetical protein